MRHSGDHWRRNNTRSAIVLKIEDGSSWWRDKECLKIPTSRQLTLALLLFFSIDATIIPATSNIIMLAMAGPERHKDVCISIASIEANRSSLADDSADGWSGVIGVEAGIPVVKRGETKDVFVLSLFSGQSFIKVPVRSALFGRLVRSAFYISVSAHAHHVSADLVSRSDEQNVQSPSAVGGQRSRSRAIPLLFRREDPSKPALVDTPRLLQQHKIPSSRTSTGTYSRFLQIQNADGHQSLRSLYFLLQTKLTIYFPTQSTWPDTKILPEPTSSAQKFYER